jgi:hypothetical protein
MSDAAAQGMVLRSASVSDPAHPVTLCGSPVHAWLECSSRVLQWSWSLKG